MHPTFFPRAPRRFTSLFLLILGLAGWLEAPAVAQQFGPIITIPIEKVREHYLNWHEDGTGKNCGVRLYGEWPAYRNYTNRTSYRIYTPGLQSIPTPQSSVPVGGRFRFYCYFNGISGPSNDSVCPDKIGEQHPDWYVEVQRRGPRALFTYRALPPEPGQFEFTSVSTDPEDEPIASEQWIFGDGTDGSGVSQVHRYGKPGTFPVRLTVTDSDGLTNAGVGNITVPAPKLTVSLRLFSKHENNRIEPGEVFRVRATVAASADGVGDLSNVAFVGPALTVPTNLTLLEEPVNIDIGTLQPGTEKVFEWVLRGEAIGDFTLLTASLTGKDAIDRTVTATRATAQGTVTALLAGIEQRPKRVVLGEDNNKDGVVNAADARVELVLGVTNVATVVVTELRTDNPAEPISLVTRLADLPVALTPESIFSGDLGSVQPGVANAVFRTNVYTATNYVYASASTVVRGKAGEVPVQTGASATVQVRNPGVKITMHALEKSGLDNDSIENGRKELDAPLVPGTSSDALDTQPAIGSGLIGDGVTPLLFKLEADTKALSVQDDPLKIRLRAVVKGPGKLGGASLQNRLRILKEGVWTASDTAEMTRSEPKVYAYLMPIASDEIEPAADRGFLVAELVVLNADSDTDLEELDFGLRKPPIALVHGYNTDGNWGAGALSIFQASRPDDARAGPFVHVIRYGQETDKSDLVSRLAGASVNTTWPLEDLVFRVHEQFQNAMKPMKTEWAFTRHDVVAHSQGGLLTRMLCAANPNHIMRQAFRNEENFNRGWFHRVVTIGSPHNGTRILRYMLTMNDAGIPFGFFTPRLVSEGMVLGRIAQKKFDPWGPEIVNLNNQHSHAPWYPDAAALFHLVRTTVNGGQPPTPDHASLADFALNLSSSLFSTVVIPRGSDGVVDFDSMAAAAPFADVGENVFTLPASLNVAHAVPSLFGGTDGGQVDAVAVANHVIGALDQVGIPERDRVFDSFRPPRPLPFSIRDAVDRAARVQSSLLNLDDLAKLEPPDANGPNRRVRPAGNGPSTFALRLTPSATRPVGSQGVFWFAELFGTNGVSTEGLTLEPDSANPTQATLHVADGVLGDVVAYAFYPTASAGNVYSKPLRVASFEPPTPAVELRVLPQGTSLPAGNAAPAQVLVRHEDGLWIQRHVAPEELTVTSAEPLTVNVSNPLEWRCESSGKSMVTATWRGLSAQGEVTVFGYRDGILPVPNPLVWLRADAGLSLTNGTNVISWTDQSRNGFVFSAPTEATRPEWVASSTSGVPAIRFNSASTPRLQGNLGRALTNATIFTVARYLNNSSGDRYIYSFGTINYSGLMMTLAREGGDDIFHYDGAAQRNGQNAVPGQGFRVFSQVYGEGSPDRHRLAVDGRTVIESRTTVGRAYSAVATNVVLGKYVTATAGFTGDLVEWLVYDRVLSVEERFEVEEYLRQRAGLSPFVSPGSLDLSSAEILDYDVTGAPQASWSLDSANRQLVQTGAGDPSLALSGFAESGQIIRTKLSASAGSGALGVVFGYQHPGSFHLFDWRQTASNHVDWGTAPIGMRLRTFHLPAGQEPTGADFWSGLDSERVTTWRTNAVPWIPGREYDVVIRIGTDETVVEVSYGATTLETWTVPELKGMSGEFGHYANFLPDARFGPAVLPGVAPVITGVELGDDGNRTVRWRHGLPPFVVESTTDLASDAWYSVAPATPNYSRTIETSEQTQFFRVLSAGVVPDGGDGEGDGRSQTFGNNGGLWLVRGTGPTRLEAENFDEGGEGVAYHETTAQNAGGLYRAEAVDIYATTDFGSGHTVGSIAAGEWLDYTIKVEVAGAYRVRARTARGQSGSGLLRFLLNGVDRTGDLVIPATGNWDAYATVESGAFELAAGTQILRAHMTSAGFNLNWIELVPVVPVVQTTFGNDGNPWSIGSTTATRIEAENFDEGGPGVAYHDTNPQNAYGAYRAEAVDIGTTTDGEGGPTLGVTAGEWLEYTIQVGQAASYRLRARTSRGASGNRTVRFLFDGVDKTGSIVVPATGNWEAYTTVESGRFELSAGVQVLRADITSGDFNLNWLELVPVVPVAQTTFGNDGNPWLVGSTAVTRIEAENFDQGGPDVAYQDADSVNQGGAYRSEDVDVQPTTDTGLGFNVSSIVAGEWLEYTIDVAAAGTYQLRFRTARAPAGSSTLRVLVDGVDKTGNVTVPRTVGWQTWTTVTKAGVSLEAGIHTLRIEMVGGDFNLNWIEIAP
jgi:PKD repeat protein